MMFLGESKLAWKKHKGKANQRPSSHTSSGQELGLTQKARPCLFFSEALTIPITEDWGGGYWEELCA